MLCIILGYFINTNSVYNKIYNTEGIEQICGVKDIEFKKI